jgi:hypothetical protein
MFSNWYTGSDQERYYPSSHKQRIGQLGSRRQAEEARCAVDFPSLRLRFPASRPFRSIMANRELHPHRPRRADFPHVTCYLQFYSEGTAEPLTSVGASGVCPEAPMVKVPAVTVLGIDDPLHVKPPEPQ